MLISRILKIPRIFNFIWFWKTKSKQLNKSIHCKTELSNLELEFLSVEKQLESVVKEAKQSLKYKKATDRFDKLMKFEEI